jgi:hypothetical protein
MVSFGVAGGAKRGAEREEKAMKAVCDSEGAETAGGNGNESAEESKLTEGSAGIVERDEGTGRATADAVGERKEPTRAVGEASGSKGATKAAIGAARDELGAEKAGTGAPIDGERGSGAAERAETEGKTEETAKNAPESGRGERLSREEERAAVAAESSKRETGERKTVSDSERLVAAPTGAGKQSGRGRLGVDKTPGSGKGAPEAPTSFERGLLPAKSNEFIVPYTIKQQRRSKIYLNRREQRAFNSRAPEQAPRNRPEAHADAPERLRAGNQSCQESKKKMALHDDVKSQDDDHAPVLRDGAETDHPYHRPRKRSLARSYHRNGQRWPHRRAERERFKVILINSTRE